MPSVLFVCTKNQFRSPIAAAAFNKKLIDEGIINNWRVDSAGTWTVRGLPPAAEAVRAASLLGLYIKDNSACPINASILSTHDLILVMELGHKEALEIEFPINKGKIFLLSKVVDHLIYDFPDPTGTNEFSPDEIAREINKRFDCKGIPKYHPSGRTVECS